MRKLFFIIILSAITVLLLVGCSAYGSDTALDADKAVVRLEFGDETSQVINVAKGNPLPEAYLSLAKDGKTVLSWTDDKGNFFDGIVSEDITLYAQWGVSVKLLDEEKNEIRTLVGRPGDSLLIPKARMRAGYNFSGWYNAMTFLKVDYDVFPNTNQTIFETFTLAQYSITYNLDGGTASNLPTRYTVIDEIALPMATKADAIFCGWKDQSGKKITNICNSTGDLTLDAVFSPLQYNGTIRYDEVSITDSGRKNQHYDVVELGNKFDLSALYDMGYDMLEVTVKLDVKESNDGYQWVFLYKDTYCTGKDLPTSAVGYINRYVLGTDTKAIDSSLLSAVKFEHGAGHKDKSWWPHTLTMWVPISELLSSRQLVIRYGASGTLEDTWINSNVALSINVYKSY